MIGLEPIIKKVKLKGSGNEVDLVLHSFRDGINSLLNDTELMKQEHLLIDKTNPFEKLTLKKKVYQKRKKLLKRKL